MLVVSVRLPAACEKIRQKIKSSEQLQAASSGAAWKELRVETGSGSSDSAGVVMPASFDI